MKSLLYSRKLILIFGIVNASLYSALLPLWEGFDEAFHYSYVETLWQTRQLPVLGRTMLQDDVAKSFPVAPVSYIVQRGIRDATSFDEWFTLPTLDKERRRRELDRLRPEVGTSARPNYEAHHPPLAYVILALVDWPLRSMPITARVLVLRLTGAVLSMVLLYWGIAKLGGVLGMPERFIHAAMFTTFCSQMLYATIAHVANDWLAVGISAMFLASLASLCENTERREVLNTALWLAAGLLTKAYFLVFALLAAGTVAVLIWRGRTSFRKVSPGVALVVVLASPWYLRNLILFKNIGGTHEAFDGIGFLPALAAARQIDWPATTGYLARASLWTGNNSFTTFSQGTLTIVLALLLLAMAAWGLRRKSIRPSEWITFAAVVLFSFAVAYASCAAYADTRGQTAGASPWYTQVLLVPVVCLAYVGMSHLKRPGAVLAIGTVLLWTWVLIATWTIKLFPLYSGAGALPGHLPAVWDWYRHEASQRMHDLSLLSLAPAPLVWAGMTVSVALSALLCAAVVRRVSYALRGEKSSEAEFMQ